MLERTVILPQYAELRFSVPFEPPNSIAYITVEPPEGLDALTSPSASGNNSKGGSTAISSGVELFGTELIAGHRYTIDRGRSVSFFAAKHASRILFQGPAYLAREIVVTNQMNFIRSAIEIHTYLNVCRAAARDDDASSTARGHHRHAKKNLFLSGSGDNNNNKNNISSGMGGDEVGGPRVLICGTSADSGKSTLAQLLCNYAARSGYHPLLLDLDCSSSQLLSFPDCISLSCQQSAFDVDEPSLFTPYQQLFHCGSHTLSKDFTLSFHAVEKAISEGEERLKRHKRTRLGGIIVDVPALPDEFAEQEVGAAKADLPPVTGTTNTTSGTNKDGTGRGGDRTERGLRLHPSPTVQFLLRVIERLDIDTVIVVGNGRLRHLLREALSGTSDTSNTAAAVAGGGNTTSSKGDSANQTPASTTTTITQSKAMTGAGTSLAFGGRGPATTTTMGPSAIPIPTATQSSGVEVKHLPHHASLSTATLNNGITTVRLILMEASCASNYRNARVRELWRKKRIGEYFGGGMFSPISSTKHEVPLSAARFIRLGSAETTAMQGLLPLDDTTQRESVSVSYVDPLNPSSNLLHTVVGVSDAFFMQQQQQQQATAQAGGSNGATGETTQQSLQWKELPHHVFESRAKNCRVIGFAVVLHISATHVWMWSPQREMPQECGLCFVVGDTVVSRPS